MKKLSRAAIGATLVGSAATLCAFQAHAQTPDFISLGESELNSGMYDQAQHDLTQAFVIAQRNHDVGTLLRLTNDFNRILNESNPPSYYRGDYEANVEGAFVTALQSAQYEACYDANNPGSGTNVGKGQADLGGIIGFSQSIFGLPMPGATGLKSTIDSLTLAAEQYLAESQSGGPNCRPAPTLAPAPAPVTAPPPVTPPSPTNTSSAGSAPISGSTPGPTNTSGPAPTNTSGMSPTSAPS